jgi:hypothetical protein
MKTSLDILAALLAALRCRDHAAWPLAQQAAHRCMPSRAAANSA